MLDQLVESSNNQPSARRGSFFATTSFLVFSLFASGIVWSLFARDLGLGADNLELSALVAPPTIVEAEPPKPEPVEPKRQQQNVSTQTNVPTRQVNMARVDEPIAPKEISTTPNSVKARPNSAFTIGKEDVDPPSTTGGIQREGTGGKNSSEPIGIKNQTAKIDEEKDSDPPPPVVKKKEEPKVEPAKTIIRSPGVLNGKAVSLPKPNYPTPARAVGAKGDVSVQVTIDEKGNVISASAVTGHLLLRQVSEQAARNAKFSPTYLGTQAVKVTGIIVYKFAMQ